MGGETVGREVRIQRVRDGIVAIGIEHWRLGVRQFVLDISVTENDIE